MPYVTVRIKGHLGEDWSEWLEGLQIACQEGDESVLVGPIADQSALYGLLAKLRNLGLELVAVSVNDNPPKG